MEDRYSFRAKRVDNGEWAYGAVLYGESHCLIGQEIKFSPYVMHECKITGYEVDPSTLCQCTGLTDRNGKLIWENDIVAHTYTKHEDFTDYPPFDLKKISKNYVIKWDSTMVYCGFRYHNGRNIFPFKKGTVINGKDEVVGNIFDNPELLEVQDEEN